MHGTAHGQNALSLANYDFDGMVKYYENGEALRRNQILQQFANGETREQYRRSDMTTEQLEAEAEKLRKEAVEDALKGKRLSKDVDTGVDFRITKEDAAVFHEIGRKNINDLASEDIQKTQKWANRLYQELGTKSPFFRAWFGDWREHDDSAVKKIDAKGDERGLFKNKDTGWDILVSKHIEKETRYKSGDTVKNAIQYLPYIDDITENSILLSSETSGKDNELSIMFHSLYGYTDVMGYPAVLKSQVEELINEKSGDPIRRDYILQSIEEEPISESKRFSKAHQTETGSSNTISIADLYSLVKSNDKDFKENPASAVVNKDGTPKVVYHGTTENFTAFERGDIGYHVGTNSQAEDRINGFENGHVMELYADIKKPLHAAFDFGDWHGKNVAGMLIETEQFEDFNNRAEIENRLSKISSMESESEADTALAEYLKELGYDGIIYDNQFEGEGESYIAFNSNQLKSATDNIGTFDESNPDIRYSKDVFTQEEREKIISEGYTDYLKRLGWRKIFVLTYKGKDSCSPSLPLYAFGA